LPAKRCHADRQGTPPVPRRRNILHSIEKYGRVEVKLAMHANLEEQLEQPPTKKT
jgi:hypothetical protein